MIFTFGRSTILNFHVIYIIFMPIKQTLAKIIIINMAKFESNSHLMTRLTRVYTSLAARCKMASIVPQMTMKRTPDGQG